MMENDKRLLYKYRSLQDFKRFMDILINNRLYTSTYDKMNDYMEGHYRYSSGDDVKKIIEELKQAKQKLRICSLSENRKNDVMLAHYADGGKGVIIGVKVKCNPDDCRKMNCDGISKVIFDSQNMDLDTKAKEILSNKTESWSYENEVRIFSYNRYINVSIEEIIFGPRTNSDDKELIRNIIKRLQLNISTPDYKDKTNVNIYTTNRL